MIECLNIYMYILVLSIAGINFNFSKSTTGYFILQIAEIIDFVLQIVYIVWTV